MVKCKEVHTKYDGVYNLQHIGGTKLKQVLTSRFLCHSNVHKPTCVQRQSHLISVPLPFALHACL